MSDSSIEIFDVPFLSLVSNVFGLWNKLSIHCILVCTIYISNVIESTHQQLKQLIRPTCRFQINEDNLCNY